MAALGDPETGQYLVEKPYGLSLILGLNLFRSNNRLDLSGQSLRAGLSQEMMLQLPSQVDLLVLSACQTAAGDNRAALGLAGVAVRAGASSTIASLWSVNDQSTAILMGRFYESLVQPAVSKAAALRQAQLRLLEGDLSHPFYWAPFVLVGN